jgi:hypothetical protein
VSNGEYRNIDTNSIIKNNNVCGKRNGLYSQSSPGWTVTDNVIKSTSLSGYSAVTLPQNEGYPNNNWIFKNNTVIANSNIPSIFYSGSVVNFASNNNYFNSMAKFSNGNLLSITQWQALGHDINSSFGGVAPSPVPTPIQTPNLQFNIADMEPDGDVDVADFNTLVSSFGLTGIAGWVRSDIIKNGTIDIFDFNKLIANFGQ